MRNKIAIYDDYVLGYIINYINEDTVIFETFSGSIIQAKTYKLFIITEKNLQNYFDDSKGLSKNTNYKKNN